MRSLLELQSYLKETYDDQIQECTLCMEIITKGQRCKVAACNSRLHQHCAAAYFKNMNNPVCPTCHSAWDGKILIGLADRTAAPSTVWKRRKAKTTDSADTNGSSRGAGGSNDAAEEDDEAEEEEDD
jgi:hypothetical protein